MAAHTYLRKFQTKKKKKNVFLVVSIDAVSYNNTGSTNVREVGRVLQNKWCARER